MIECKPEKLILTPLVSAKVSALTNLAESREWVFQITDPGVVEFELLTELIESGRVGLTDRTLERMRAWQN